MNFIIVIVVTFLPFIIAPTSTTSVPFASILSSALSAASATSATAVPTIKCGPNFSTYKIGTGSTIDGVACVYTNSTTVANLKSILVYAEGVSTQSNNKLNYRLLAYGDKPSSGGTTLTGAGVSPANPGELTCGGMVNLTFILSGGTGMDQIVIYNSKDAYKTITLTKASNGVAFKKLPMLQNCGPDLRSYKTPQSDNSIVMVSCFLFDHQRNQARVRTDIIKLATNQAAMSLGLWYPGSSIMDIGERGFTGERSIWYIANSNWKSALDDKNQVIVNDSQTLTIYPTTFTMPWTGVTGAA